MPKLFGRFSSSECKTQAKLCIGRIRLMRNKRQIAMGQMRKEIADLLRANKQENARIRVESVIREINLLQAYEVLEIFVELLTVRLQLIEKSKDVPNDMFECLASLIYSSSRIQDFPELAKIRDMLGRKFGQEFLEKCSSDSSCRQFMVNENLIHYLAIGAPDPDLKLQILSDIAQQHEVEWDSHRAHQEMLSGAYAPRNFGGPGGPSQGGPGGGNFGPGGPPGGFGGGGGGGQGVVHPPPSPLFQPPPNDFAPGPVTPSQSSGSKLQRNLKHLVSLGRKSNGGSDEWADANSAAAAAREYSQNAQKAADAAHRYANPNAGVSGVQPPQNPNTNIGLPPPQFNGGFAQGNQQFGNNQQYPDLSGRPSPSPLNPGAPPQNQNQNQAKGPSEPKNTSPPDPTPFEGQQPPNFTPMTTSLNQEKDEEGKESGKSPSLPPGQYRQRSTEDIQRDYDAAGGPPLKKGTPSAPPVISPPNSPPPPEDTQGQPSPPNGDKASGGMDSDLLARFNALKNG